MQGARRAPLALAQVVACCIDACCIDARNMKACSALCACNASSHSACVFAAAFATRKVAGRERRHEEATRTAPEPAEPYGPRRCGGPEHTAGLSISVGQRTLAHNRTK